MRLIRGEKAVVGLCLLVLIITGLLIWQNRKSVPGNSFQEKLEEKFRGNQILIHQNLHELYRSYSVDKVSEAQNTFLDMKQLWQRQEVLAKVLNMNNYLTSDSLQSLENLLDKPFSYSNSLSVRQEIKRINERISKH